MPLLSVVLDHHINLIDRIENIQRRFTKRLPGLHDIKYVEILLY